MELFERKNKNCIEGIDSNILTDILEYKNKGVKIDTIVQNRIYLSDETALKCINSYYKVDEKTIKSDKSINACFRIQKFFNINCDNFDCRRCHIEALKKFKENAIEKI